MIKNTKTVYFFLPQPTFYLQQNKNLFLVIILADNVVQEEQKPIICVKYATKTRNGTAELNSNRTESKMILLLIFTAGG